MLARENVSFKCYKKMSHPKAPGEGQGWTDTEVNDTLNIFDNGETRTPTLIVGTYMDETIYGIDMCAGRGVAYFDVDVSPTHCADGHTNAISFIKENGMEEMKTVVRRLTPKECERLQGFDDDWTNLGEWVDSNGKKHKDADSPRYKALGNSIALPFWQWLATRIATQLKKDGVENPTMASLFDGIGGFPVVFKRAGVKPVWASEIEEFPIAVTKKHFPEEGENK